MTADTSRLRLAVLGVVATSLFAALTARLWYLQVLDTAEFRVAAEANQVRLVYEPAPRGRILDREGRVLVDNRVVDVLTLSRVEAHDHPEVLPRVAALLGVPKDEVIDRILDPKFSPYRPVPLAIDVPEDKIVYIREHQEDFPGVDNSQVTSRVYPQGSLAAHVLGYVGEITTELEDKRDEGYRLGDDIGKTGVEQSLEQYLRGDAGVTKLEVDSKGRRLRTLGQVAPVQGDDVQLTIDLDIQRLAEESLAQGLQAAQQHWDRDQKKHFIAPAGAVVVLDPNDGSVLAMASHPTYDPGAFIDGVSQPTWAALNDPANHYPLNNRAIQGLYAPGSTFKLVTALASLRDGVIAPNTTILDEGKIRIGDRTFRNAGSHPWGRVDLVRAIAVSSDVYFYKLGYEYWRLREQFGDGIQAVARELGFGQQTGINLPSERRGRVPTPEIRQQLHDDNPEAFPNGEWYGGDNVNLAIGQGEMVATPLQLASAYAAVGNGGTVYQPRMAAQTLRPDGELSEDLNPRAIRQLSFGPEVRGPILAGLRGAIANADGTAHAAFAGFSAMAAAGKTGTAQVFGKQDTAIFVGMAPVPDPKYVISVVLEEGGFGGETAASIARRILAGLAGEPPEAIRIAEALD
ncbi:MAG TPA: penicillin-binding protein 2 [Acidimicrobiales bacterium]|nr:penicillin-binding protein 2 [Acidimicrobiales bacterium]